VGAEPLSNESVDRRSSKDRRETKDRRSGGDTRPIEEQFLQGERRSGIDRRSSGERRYRSFKKARAFTRELGLKSIIEWRDYCKSGSKPNDIPAAPHNAYAAQWAGWSDWLAGRSIETYLTHNRAFLRIRAFARKAFGF
jgi:hypothetical protein